MAKLSKTDFMNNLKTILGDRTDDEALKLLEDANDTISDGGADDWETKYNEQVEANKKLDLEWRTKYRDRFYSPDTSHIDNTKTNPANTDKDKSPEDIEDEKLEQANKVTFDDLFKGEEK